MIRDRENLVYCLFIVAVTALLFLNLNHIFNAYGQNNISTFQKQVKAIDDMPFQSVNVGDIDIAYKRLGNNNENPIVLIGGGSMTMDMWNPILLRELSSNHVVIIFDNRGTGNSTLGTKEFSINQFANDTANFLDALNIEKADVLGFSMGSFIAQELTIKNPNKVNNLVLHGSSCGGKEAIPPSAKASEALDVFTKKSSPKQTERDTFASTMFPPDWFKTNTNYEDYIPIPKESVTPEITQRQKEAIFNWWSVGTCNELQSISQRTLVIVGTDDVWIPAANSLMIAEKIPEASLIQVEDAGHGLMNQYPDKFSKVVSEFLEGD